MYKRQELLHTLIGLASFKTLYDSARENEFVVFADSTVQTVPPTFCLLYTSCDNAVVEGMVVHTNSPRVREARRVNLRLILSQHEICCTKCTRSGSCKLQTLCNDYNLLGDHYIKDLKNIPTDFSNPVVRIENRCIRCMRCIQVCEKIQTMNIWDVVGTGTRTTVGVGRFHTLGESDCTFCGQCITCLLYTSRCV